MALDSASFGFLETLAIGVITATIIILIFCCIRPKVPDVFEHRSLLNTWKSHHDFNGTRVPVITPRPNSGFFGWLKPIFTVTEEEIVRKLGLDAAMFLRYLRSCLRVTLILSVFGAAVLMPAYGTGSNKGRVVNPTAADGNKLEPIEGLKVVSLANVPAEDPRLWATLAAEFFVAAVVVYVMAMDYRRFAELRRDYRVAENPVNYALVVYDVPDDCLSEGAIRNRFELMVPGQVAEVVLVRQCGNAMKLQKKLDTAVTKRELAEYIKATKGEPPEFRPGFCGCCMCHKPKVDALEYWSEEQHRLSTEIEDLGSTEKVCPSAIVVFTNKRAAALLAQANISTDSSAWTVERAAEPEGVNWKAFSVPSYQVEIRRSLVFAFVLAFTLFWTIPATLVVGLVNVVELSKKDPFKWLDFVADLPEAVVGIIENVLPNVVLAVLISFIPKLFRWVVSNERLSSMAIVERKTRDYFYFFQLYGSFLVIVIGASVLRDVSKLADDPSVIVDSLAEGVPGTGLFFATFITLKTFIPLPLQLSSIVRCILRFVFLKLAKTERQKRKARSGGSLFQYFRYSGQAMLIMFLALMFSSLAPVVPITAVLYFGLANVVFRYLLYFTMYAPWEGGGGLYVGCYWGTMIGLVLKQLVVIGVLGLNKVPTQAALCIIPVLFTVLTSLSVHRRYGKISEHGSLHDMYEESSKVEEIPAQYNGIYEQPAGKHNEYENLNGLEDVKDVHSDVQYDESDADCLQSEHHDDQVGYVPDRAAIREEV